MSPGRTPFLIARPTLEEWKVKQDFATGKMKIADGEWFEPTRGEKGHYVLKLLKKKETIYHVVSDMGSFAWRRIEMYGTWKCNFDEEGSGKEEIEMTAADEEVMKVVDSTLQRQLKFFEVYVDRGNLSQHLGHNFPDVVR